MLCIKSTKFWYKCDLLLQGLLGEWLHFEEVACVLGGCCEFGGGRKEGLAGLYERRKREIIIMKVTDKKGAQQPKFMPNGRLCYRMTK